MREILKRKNSNDYEHCERLQRIKDILCEGLQWEYHTSNINTSLVTLSLVSISEVVPVQAKFLFIPPAIWAYVIPVFSGMS